MTDESTYFVRFPDKTSGPFTEAQLQKLIGRGRLQEDSLVSSDQQVWMPASQLPLDFANVDSGNPPTAQSFCPRCNAGMAAQSTTCASCGYDFGHAAVETSSDTDFFSELFSSSDANDTTARPGFFRVVYAASLIAGFALAIVPVALFVNASEDLMPVTARHLAILLILPILCFMLGAFSAALLLFAVAPGPVWEHRLGRQWMRIFGTQKRWLARLLCWIHVLLICALLGTFVYFVYFTE